MASPFSMFRKNQRWMMAIFGVLLMIAFTVGGVQMGMEGAGGGSDPGNKTVVTSKYGRWSEVDIEGMKIQRRMVGQFLILTSEFLYRDVMEQIRTQRITPNLQQVDQAIGVLRRFGENFLAIDEEALVKTHILAGQASDLGIVVGEDAVNSFLETISLGQVSDVQFNQSLDFLRKERRLPITKAMIDEAIRTDLLARQMFTIFDASALTTPAQRWDYYQRLKQNAKVELVAFPAADKVNEVAEPSESELKEFFDKYRDKEPQPGSPDPGFKIPRRVAFDFFVAEWDKYYEPKSITPAEILAYYEKNKASLYRFRDFGLREYEEAPATTEDEKKTEAEKKEVDAAPKTDTDAAKPEAKPAETKEPEATDKADQDPSEDNTECGADDKPADAPIAADAPATAAADQPKADDKSTATDKPAATDKSAATETPAASDKPAVPVAPAFPTANPNMGLNAPLNMGQPGASAPLPLLSETYVLPRDVLSGPNPEFQPLWDVEDAIRLHLAREKAVKKINDVLTPIQEDMRSYAGKLPIVDKEDKTAKKVPKPTPLDIEALAKKEGVTASRTGLVSQYDLSKLPGFGSSSVEGMPVAGFTFDSEHLYITTKSVDSAGNTYLFWKTEDEPARVPEFAEVKKEVLQVWKLRKARDLVKKEAETLVAKANEAKQSLQEAIKPRTDLLVVDSPRFSWLDQGTAGRANARAPVSVSEVVGVVDPGDDFMRAVFALNAGQSGVAMNQPQTIAYAVKMLELIPQPATLRDEFLADSKNPNLITPALEIDVSKWRQQWVDDQMGAAKLDWVRPPQKQRLMGG